MTLTEVCERYAKRQIHFLKIDVEGHEGAVIAGTDFTRFRPWIMVIEATEPNNLDVPTYDEWDGAVLAAGYRFAHTDRLNRYYVAAERPELMGAFSLPADDYVLARDLRHRQSLEQELEAARRRILELEAA